jgi:hypothetical protein
MATVQRDMFTGGGRAHFREAVEARMGRQTWFCVAEVAGIFETSETTVREWIEEGRLAAANLNAGRTVPIDAARPGMGERPMRPYWRITRAAVIDLAARMEQGI